MDYNTRILKREIMRDMINVMIATIYRDGGKPFLPLIEFECKIHNSYKEIATKKCVYIALYSKVYDVKNKKEISIVDRDGNSYAVNYINEDNGLSTEISFMIKHKTKGLIKPVKNSNIEKRMADMFSEVFYND